MTNHTNGKEVYVVAVAALMENSNGDVLLVQQQTSSDPDPLWTIPGGQVEKEESLLDALRREVKEETGLEELIIGELVLVTESEDKLVGTKRISFVFEVESYEGDLNHQDPDGSVMSVQFVSKDTAIEKLKSNPLIVLREPMVNYLKVDRTAKSFYQYVTDKDGTKLVPNK